MGLCSLFFFFSLCVFLWILYCSQNDEYNQFNWNMCFFSHQERTTVGITCSHFKSWFLVLIYCSEAKFVRLFVCFFAWVACWIHAVKKKKKKWVSEGKYGFFILANSNSRVAHREQAAPLKCFADCSSSSFVQGCCSVYIIKALACLCYSWLLHLCLTFSLSPCSISLFSPAPSPVTNHSLGTVGTLLKSPCAQKQ